jgi:2-polyprenyl-3-methyl-5-hydroxy-6-metoxy-1,4-benzoquinol methylase
MDIKNHWENIYATKRPDEVSWYQPAPEESINFFNQLLIPKTAPVIDIGGGDSLLVDHLLDMGYTDLTVLDISSKAINRAKKRLGSRAKSVKWIISDITDFKTIRKYDCWHDRAAFHFLNSAEQVEKYIEIANNHITPKGKLILATFSTDGPDKCSGLTVKKYNQKLLVNTLKKWFSKIKCITANHTTPFNTKQSFLFCSFKKIAV